MKSRVDYYKKIWQYEKRRRLIKDKYGSGKTTILTKKISQWKNEIRRIDKRNQKLKSIIKLVNQFFLVNIESNKMDTQHKLARKVFYKYAMEQGYEGVFVSNSIGRVNIHTASHGRLSFTRSFKTNKENKQQYHNFLNSTKP